MNLINFLSIPGVFQSLLITLCNGVYRVAAFAFQIFLILATGQLLDTSDYELMITNFYVILGIVMLFVLAFTLLKGMVNPDEQKKGATTVKKVIINLVTSALILALLPTIFGFAFDFQTAVIVEQNSIGKFFNYGGSSNDNVATVKQGANQIVNGVYTAFLNVNGDNCANTINSKEALEACQGSIPSEDKKRFANESSEQSHTFLETINYVDQTGSFGAYNAFAENIANDDTLDFNFLLSLIGGLILVYIAVSFCFDMAVRLVKLVFYQLIAPIPLFLRIVPEGKLSDVFSKWVKITLTCYLEVYIRIFIFYFCIYLCNAMLGSDFINKQVYGWGAFVALITQAFILMGIITFMRSAPKLFSEVTGLDSGNMKLGIKDKLAAGGGFVAGSLVGAGVTSMVRNGLVSGGAMVNKYKENRKAGKGKFRSVLGASGSAVKFLTSTAAGTVSGAFRGGYAGLNAKNYTDVTKAASKGAKGAVDARVKRANYKAAHGGSTLGATIGHLKDAGVSIKNYALDQSIEGLTRESNSMGKLASSYNSFSDGIESLLEKEQGKGNGSVFLSNGFTLSQYTAFDAAAQNLAKARADFNTGRINAAALRTAEQNYSNARDSARDELMNMVLEGSKGSRFTALTAKGQAALKDSMVNAESLQAVILENANSSVVQSIMGPKGNNALDDIAHKRPLSTSSFEFNHTKLKDAAKVAQGQADIRIAEMNKENAAKGEKK